MSIVALDESVLAPLRRHHPPTYEHCVAVGAYAYRLARALDLPDDEASRAGSVGRLHDLGTLGLPRRLLDIDAPMDRHHARLMSEHTIASAALVKERDVVASLAPAVRAHHERFDGHGYPDGLKGENIPLLARIVAVADTFDALVRGRPYRQALGVSTAIEILHIGRGRQWQPEVVDVFASLIESQGLRAVT